MDLHSMWALLDAHLGELENGKQASSELITTLELNIKQIGGDLDSLSKESVNLKNQHKQKKSHYDEALHRLEYVQSIHTLVVDTNTFNDQIELMDSRMAVTTLKDVLQKLKMDLSNLYYHAFCSQTDESTNFAAIKSNVTVLGDDSAKWLGMRNLIPPYTWRRVMDLVKSTSNICKDIGVSWLSNSNNMLTLLKEAGQILASFNSKSPQSYQPASDPTELQFAQQVFWLSRTCQELQTLVSGVAIDKSSVPLNKSTVFSSQISQRAQSYGVASHLFELYWTDLAAAVDSKFDQICSVKNPTLEQHQSILKDMQSTISRIWVATNLLWHHSLPSVQNSEFASLDFFLQPTADLDQNLYRHAAEYNVSPIGLPQFQSEVASFKLALAVNSAVHPLVDNPTVSNLNWSDSSRLLSTYIQFWNNILSGPWYLAIQSGVDRTRIITDYFPQLSSLQLLAHQCSKALKKMTESETQNLIDDIWSHPNADFEWFQLLQTCATILLCAPHHLQAEDLLVQSLSTSSQTKPSFDQLQRIAGFLEREPTTSPDDALWCPNSLFFVLDRFKMGALRKVMHMVVIDQAQKCKI